VLLDLLPEEENARMKYAKNGLVDEIKKHQQDHRQTTADIPLIRACRISDGL
jgi:hypothetical protein